MSNARNPVLARPAVSGVSPWDPVDLGTSAAREAELEPPTVTPVDAVGPDLRALLDQAAARERALAAALEQERVERETRVAEAFQRGLVAGRAEGKAMEAERLRGAMAVLEAVAAEVRDSGLRWGAVLEENVCALAMAVARHVLGRELKGDRLAVLGLAREAIGKFGLDEPLRIRVNERDYQLLTAGQDDDLVAVVAGREVVWVADPTVEVGGCVVEGPDRIVDGRVDTALERVYRRLTLTHA